MIYGKQRKDKGKVFLELFNNDDTAGSLKYSLGFINALLRQDLLSSCFNNQVQGSQGFFNWPYLNSSDMLHLIATIKDICNCRPQFLED